MLASTYGLTTLNGVTNLRDQSPEPFAKVAAPGELEFLGADASTSTRKRFDFSTPSYGVLTEVRQGGLKRDLAIAFKNDRVFNAAFSPTGFPTHPSRSSSR